MARPSIFTEDLGDRICAQIAAGMPLSRVCAQEGFPADETVIDWFLKGEAGDERYLTFSAKYARAREAQTERFVDEIVEIADTEEVVERARIRIDARKWVAGKTRPKKYGDKYGIGGAEDLPPIQTKDASLTDVARKMAFILTKATETK